MKKYSLIITSLFILSVIMSIRLYTDRTETIEEKIVRDTVVIHYPVAYDTILIDNPRKVYIPIVEVDISEDDSCYILDTETIHYRDSLYEAWVSGISPKLDSIKVFNKTVIRTVTRTVPEYKFVQCQPLSSNKVTLNGFVSGYSSFDINHIDIQGGLAVNWKDLTLKGGYNIGKDNSYPFFGIELKIR